VSAFHFEAARADGHAVKGLLDAPSRSQAAATLSARGLFPVVVEPAPEGLFSRRRASTRALAAVIQSLATLVDAGVPLAQALDATQKLAPAPLGEALGRVAARVRQGTSLGTSLAEERALFSGLTVGLVRAGERGVGLGPALLQAAAQLGRQAETAARVRAALAYPVLLAAVGSLSVGLIVLFVVPRFAAILGDLGQALPPATRALIGISGAARRYGLLLAAGGEDGQRHDDLVRL
jgi:general secretion pathway protein F